MRLVEHPAGEDTIQIGFTDPPLPANLHTRHLALLE
jgi:hypothetical protein